MSKKTSKKEAQRKNHTARKRLPKGIHFLPPPDLPFNAKSTLKWLLKDDPDHIDAQEALFAGFCAWMIAPGKRRFINDVVKLRCGELVAVSEQGAVGEAESSRRLTKEIKALAEKWYGLYATVYYPLGGISAVLHASRRGTIAACFKRREIMVRQAVLLVSIWHTVKEEKLRVGSAGDQEQANLISITKGVSFRVHDEVLKMRASKDPTSILNRPKLSRTISRGLYDSWPFREWGAAFIYAASSVLLNGDESILDRLLSGRLSLGEIRPHFAEWMGRAKHVQKTIIEQLPPDVLKEKRKEGLTQWQSSKNLAKGVRADGEAKLPNPNTGKKNRHHRSTPSRGWPKLLPENLDPISFHPIGLSTAEKNHVLTRYSAAFKTARIGKTRKK